MRTKLLIFDLDGTLVDSSADISNALNYAIKPFGIAPVSVAETITLVGEGVTRLIGKLLDKRGSEIDLALLLERFLRHYSAHFADLTRPYPGTEEVLTTLSGYKKAIISNKLESLSLQVLDALDLRKYFDYVAGADTVAQKKPSPEPVFSALSRFAATPEEALLVGDSIYDIDAGRAAGVRTVAALYGYGSPGFAAKADHEIKNITELLDVIKQIDPGA
jgi:phosphoglycolate phosphatase